MVEKEVPAGTIRIKTRDLLPYEKTKSSWKRANKEFPEAAHIIQLFKAHNNFKVLIDQKNPEFLKGQLSPDNKPQGARINILPNNKKLDKAFSLFCENLAMHDESSSSHWDVIYKNPGGTYSYIYTLDKKKKSSNEKYDEVRKFEKIHSQLQSNVSRALKDDEDYMALPMCTLLKTYMRIGNEIYFRLHKHKGLTTQKKGDVTLKGNNVTFKYIAKDGVPMTITEKFPEDYIKRLKQKLEKSKKTDFIFSNPETNHPLKETEFKKAFLKYCGHEFYPHIVRSYYATKKTEEFIKTHKSATKEEVRELFLSIAEKLGHKRFSKKKHQWEDNYNVTIRSYIKPKLVEKVQGLVR